MLLLLCCVFFHNLVLCIYLQGALIHCNIVLKSLHRLEHVIQNALQQWETQRFKQLDFMG